MSTPNTYDKGQQMEKAELMGRAFYACVHRPQHDRENDKYIYKVDLCLTTPEGKPIVVLDKNTGEKINQLDKAEKLGLIIKEETKGVPGKWVRIKRERKEKLQADGTTKITQPPTVLEKGNKPLDSGIDIGNESLVKVKFTVIPIKKGEYKGKKNTPYLNEVLVHNLVPYVRKVDEDQMEFDVEMLENSKNAKPTASVKDTVNTADSGSPFIDDIED
jgi:hypothetical protein